MRLTSGQQEIFFVATPDSNKQYTFELDVAESAKEHAMTSGTYSLVICGCMCMVCDVSCVCVCMCDVLCVGV